MSEVSDHAVVRVIIADYVTTDAGGKVTVVGGGLTALSANSELGITAPFGVYVSVTVPAELAGQEATLELVLEDADGDPVGVQDAAGGVQPIRIGQTFTFQEQRYDPFPVPAGLMRPRHQVALMLAPGLPVQADRLYTWRVKLDQDTRDDWTEQIYYLGLQPTQSTGA